MRIRTADISCTYGLEHNKQQTYSASNELSLIFSMFCPLIHNNFRILLAQMFIFMVTYGLICMQLWEFIQYYPEQDSWRARMNVATGRQLWHDLPSLAIYSAPPCAAFDKIAVCNRLLYGLFCIKYALSIFFQIYIQHYITFRILKLL